VGKPVVGFVCLLCLLSCPDRSKSQREAVVSSLVFVHQSVHNAMQQVCRRCRQSTHAPARSLMFVHSLVQLARARQGRSAYVTPRHYLVRHWPAVVVAAPSLDVSMMPQLMIHLNYSCG
jgi:hypothetical protein